MGLENGLAIGQSNTVHGGRISGSNGPNGGANFRFTLPVVGLDSCIGELVRQKYS
jgi:hypothetical protein